MTAFQMKSWTHLHIFSLFLLIFACVGMNYQHLRRTTTSFSDLSYAPIHLTSSPIETTFDTSNGTIVTPMMGEGQSYEYTIDYDKCDRILLVFESLEMNAAEMKISELSQRYTGNYLFTWSRSDNSYDRAVVCMYNC